MMREPAESRLQAKARPTKLLVLCLILTTALPAQDPLRLSMKRAVELATSPEGNGNMQIAGEAVKQAEARSIQARAALLP